MYRKKLVILFTILLLSIISMGQQQDGSVFERRVTINQENQPLDYILEQISWQAGVFFSYNASIINSGEKYSVSANNKSLYSILNEIFNPGQYNLTELENQIIISKINADSTLINRNDSIPVKYFFLTGKLVDNKKGKPIKYASVSVFKKPIGTISNNDGDFLLKLHPDNIRDTVIISCMGYAQKIIPAFNLLDEDLLILNPVSIRIKEVRVTAITTEQLLENIWDNIDKNYSAQLKLMTAFYRETVKQDDHFINVSEAVTEILKSPYINTFREDWTRLVKGRRSPDVQPFKWLNFKLQGGPFTITKLDVVKTVESFLDPQYEELYKYEITKVIWFNDHPVYVVHFYPSSDFFYPAFEGEMYVHRETFAVVHANYRLNKSGLKKAASIMIKKKPPKVKARPTYVQYRVNYRQYQGKWYLSTAQASVKFKIRSKRDKVNSEFHSVSDLLITDVQDTDLKRFTSNETFKQRDIFVEELGSYDEKFWENYNIIKPDEDLRKAFKSQAIN